MLEWPNQSKPTKAQWAALQKKHQSNIFPTHFLPYQQRGEYHLAQALYQQADLSGETITVYIGVIGSKYQRVLPQRQREKNN